MLNPAQENEHVHRELTDEELAELAQVYPVIPMCHRCRKMKSLCLSQGPWSFWVSTKNSIISCIEPLERFRIASDIPKRHKQRLPAGFCDLIYFLYSLFVY